MTPFSVPVYGAPNSKGTKYFVDNWSKSFMGTIQTHDQKGSSREQAECCIRLVEPWLAAKIKTRIQLVNFDLECSTVRRKLVSQAGRPRQQNYLQKDYGGMSSLFSIEPLICQAICMMIVVCQISMLCWPQRRLSPRAASDETNDGFGGGWLGTRLMTDEMRSWQKLWVRCCLWRWAWPYIN